MTTARGVGPLLRADARRTRAKLLEAARRRVAAGDTALALNAVARDAGVGVGTAYRHFPDRQTLLEGLAAQALARLVKNAQAAAANPDAAAGLTHLLRAALLALADDAALAEVLRSPAPVCLETLDLTRDLAAAAGDLLRHARTSGAVRRDLDPDDLRRLLVGVHAAVQAGARDAQASPALDRYLDVLVAGLREPGPAPSARRSRPGRPAAVGTSVGGGRTSRKG